MSETLGIDTDDDDPYAGLVFPPEWEMEDPPPVADGPYPDLPIDELADIELIELLQHTERLRAQADALQVRVMARLSHLRSDGRYVGDEVAAALDWASPTASNKVQTAVNLVERLPETVAALERGEVDFPKATAILEWTEPLSVDQAREVAAQVLPWSTGRTVSAVRAKLSREVHKVDPDGAAARTRERRKRRKVEYRPLPDGMAELLIYDSAERIRAFYELLDYLARRAKAAGDKCTLDALRTDALMDLILGPNWERVKIELRITVPSSVLAGVSDHPAQLHGYGPIASDTLWELAGKTAFWRRIITDPVAGTVREVSRRQPPGRLREYLATRTPTCVGIGCNRPAETCEVDHTVDYAKGGPTTEANAGPACQHHNLMKLNGGWTLDQPKPGHFIWTSPAGLKYEVHPQPVVDPTPDPVINDNTPPPF
jgi:hypothetical protein